MRLIILLGRYLTVVFMTLITLTFSSKFVMAQGGYWGMGPGMMGTWGMGWFGGIFMMVFWILIIIALVFFIRWLVRSTESKQDRRVDESRALEILKERYARGEIDTEEFEQKKRLLLS